MTIEDLKQIKKELKSLKPRKGILENIKKECRTLSVAKEEKTFKAKHRYKFISAIAVSLVVVITLSILLPLLLRDSGTTEDYTVGLKFNLTNENFYEVSAGDIKDKDIIIPSSYNNLNVKQIAENGFMNASIESVLIPDSVVTIGDGAFYGSGLKRVDIPLGVTSIGTNVFAYCGNLTNVSIPYSVTNIGTGAFAYCTSLKEIEISDNIKSIGNNAFSNCTSLDSITIPLSVVSIGAGAFSNCDKLKIYCEVKEKPDGWADDWTDSIVDWADDDVGDEETGQILTYTLINKDEYEVSKGNVSAELIIIPSEYEYEGRLLPVTRIANNAFIDSDIVNIIIPDSIKSIGEKAFYRCGNLKSIIIPKSVTKIGLNAFDLTLTIYIEAKNKHNNDWLGEWSSSKRPVVWGCEILYDNSKPYVNSFIVTSDIKGSVVYSAPFRIGYNFDCWKSESGTKYDAAHIHNSRNNVELRAQWLKIDEL